MGAVRKTFTLTEQQDAWISTQIADGLYTDDSEAIRDLIRREQERRFEVETIREALIEGEQSGEPEPSTSPRSRGARQPGLAEYRLSLGHSATSTRYLTIRWSDGACSTPCATRT